VSPYPFADLYKTLPLIIAGNINYVSYVQKQEVYPESVACGLPHAICKAACQQFFNKNRGFSSKIGILVEYINSDLYLENHVSCDRQMET
jgi:hypothetical protein